MAIDPKEGDYQEKSYDRCALVIFLCDQLAQASLAS